MKDLHTFAICAYQDSPYLEACIRSAMGQSRPAKVILCTSTPSPYLERLAKAYRIPMFVREGEPGIGRDWNFAYRMADSRYVTIAHQDDLYGRDYVRELERAVSRYPDMCLFATAYVTVKNRTLARGERLEWVKRLLRLPLSFPKLNHIPLVKKAALSFGNSICCPTCAYRKEEGEAGKDSTDSTDNTDNTQPVFSESLRFVLDWEHLICLAEGEGRFICAEKPLVYHRLHPEAATNACMKGRLRLEEEEAMFSRLWPGPVVKGLMKYYQKAYDSYEDG